MPHSILIQALIVVFATILLAIGLFLLSIYKRLFSGIRNIWIRRNLAVLSIAIFFWLYILLMFSGEIATNVGKKGFVGTILKELGQMFICVVFVFNVVWLVSRMPAVKKMSFVKHHAIIIISIVASAAFIFVAVSYVDNGMQIRDIHKQLMYAYFYAIVTGLVYTAVNYVELERKRKLNEKELEVTRLMALKTKAELDALHSKINPHFLYNALNSIADLSITDGKKARQMTVALADLFRYSINYSDHNYSTVKEELEMTEVYLQIEKIRFEDKLTYSISLANDVSQYLVPRFMLQPVVENAVKHGLKATGKMTEIDIEVKNGNGSLQIFVGDNGPAFPDELVPGYGVKSIYDKLDLLFPDNYEIHFSNHPSKKVSIYIRKLIKNEPAV